MARKLEELPIYSALLDRPAFGRNRKLRDQIDEANDSILSNISEGFEQPTDKAFEKYLFLAKGSAAEVLTRLATAWRKGCITAEEFADRGRHGIPKR